MVADIICGWKRKTNVIIKTELMYVQHLSQLPDPSWAGNGTPVWELEVQEHMYELHKVVFDKVTKSGYGGIVLRAAFGVHSTNH